MSIGAEVTTGTVISGATLLAFLGGIWRASAWKSQVDAERKAEKEAREASEAANETAHHNIMQTLGNGAPGTVVRTALCERMHEAVRSELGVVRDDIRELRRVVEGK